MIVLKEILTKAQNLVFVDPCLLAVAIGHQFLGCEPMCDLLVGALDGVGTVAETSGGWSHQGSYVPWRQHWFPPRPWRRLGQRSCTARGRGRRGVSSDPHS